MIEYPSGMPEEPTGIGSIIRVVFKDPGDGYSETFYIGALPHLWIEYGSDVVEEFTWRQMLQIIEYDEAEEFEVVYEGFDPTKMYDLWPHIKDWIWREAL